MEILDCKLAIKLTFIIVILSSKTITLTTQKSSSITGYTTALLSTFMACYMSQLFSFHCTISSLM